MIAFIKEWVNQIIVAVIIATILEMILPEGKNKKYIKMIIGIYVLFSIVQPIATKITGKEFKIDTNYEKYFNDDILKTSSDTFENNNSKLIEQTYIDNIKSNIKAKIEQKGYSLASCNVNIVTNSENYGAIRNITLRLKETEEENTNSIVEIEKVEVNLNNKEVDTKNNITIEEKQSIIEYLAGEYSIDKNRIVID